MSGILKVPKGVATVTVGPILGGSGGSDARGFVVGGGGGGSIGATKIPAHLIVDSSIGGYPLSASNTFQNFVDHTITGQTIMVEFRTPIEYFDSPMSNDDIKEKLVRGLAHEMFNKKCIEFTQMRWYIVLEFMWCQIHKSVLSGR
jgi:hypothetical protein